MFPAILASLALFQYRVDPVRGAEIAQAAVGAQAVARSMNQNATSKLERRRFEEKFNLLVSAIYDFQQEYNASGGRVWPKKKADALKKAIKDLQIR